MAMPTRMVVAVMISGFVLAGCGRGPSPSSTLPGNNEIDAWVYSSAPIRIDTDAALYSQIDGGAPKYIDRGWLSSVYATYQQNGSTLQVAVHDMGNASNASAIYQFDLPTSRVQIDGNGNAVVDMGLATVYQAKAYAGRFYIEVSIDDHSDAALDSVRRFTLAILDRCAS